MKRWIGLFIGLCLASCSSNKEEVVTSLPDIKWDMQRLDRAIALASSEAAIDSILKNTRNWGLAISAVRLKKHRYWRAIYTNYSKILRCENFTIRARIAVSLEEIVWRKS